MNGQYCVKKLINPIDWTVTVPGSKSMTNRVLLLAALQKGKITIDGVLFSDDSRAVSSKEIGYAISPKHQRNGFAFEAISAMVNLLQKDLLVDMVVAGVLPENIPSIKLLEKLGFSREGIRHKALWHESLDKPVDLQYYYLDR